MIDWDALRSDWPHVAEGVCWLQHAGITPPCRRVMGAANSALEAFALDPQRGYRPMWNAATGGAREKVAAFLGTVEEQVALVKNTSQGLIFVAEGLDVPAGANIVTLAGEYPANRLPWRGLERKGVTLRTVEMDAEGRLPVDRIAAAVDDDTLVLAVSWVQYLNGFRCDLAALADVARRHGAWFVVDGVQGAGIVPLELDGIDAFAVGGHKWMCGAEGAGYLYVSPRLLDALTTVNVGWYSVAEELAAPGREVLVESGVPALKSGAVRFEEGTPNAYGNVMLGEAATMLAEIGVKAIHERVLGLQDHLIELLRPRGYEVTSSLRPGERSGSMCLSHPEHAAGDLVRRLSDERIVTIQRCQSVRLSPHCYNNAADMERVASVLP